jgi:hypothetical protein
MPKRGGGRGAFRSGEARMPAEHDDDHDGINSGWFGKDGGRIGAYFLSYTRHYSISILI